MDDRILSTIKGMLGIDEECDAYDQDLVVYINAVFSTLYQIGLTDQLQIIQRDQTWNDLFSDNLDVLDLIKLYTFTRVKLLFDPPTSSFVLDALKKQSDELEWRIHFQSEGGFDDSTRH